MFFVKIVRVGVASWDGGGGIKVPDLWVSTQVFIQTHRRLVMN